MIYVVSIESTRGIFNPPLKSVFDELLKAPTRSWWHFMNATWIIVTSESLDQLTGRLNPHLHPKDLMLVVPLQMEYRGWLPREAWEWINQHIDNPERNSRDGEEKG